MIKFHDTTLPFRHFLHGKLPPHFPLPRPPVKIPFRAQPAAEDQVLLLSRNTFTIKTDTMFK